MTPFDLKKWSQFPKCSDDYTIVDQIVVDSRRVNSPNALFVPLQGKEVDGHQFILKAFENGAKYALAKKGCNLSNIPEGKTLIKVDDPLEALQEIALAYRKSLNCKIVAVAGSYGKTMAKDLLHALLDTSFKTASSPESFNSQIGVPLSLFTLSAEDQIAIIEMGFSKPGEMERLANMVRPDFGLVTNIGKKHLATLETLEKAVLEILSLIQQKNLEWVIAPKSELIDPFLDKIAASLHFWNLPEKTLPFASFEKDSLIYKIHFPQGEPFSDTVKEGFSYFLDLVNICVKAAWKLGVSSEAIKSVMKNYFLQPMRTEIWQSNESIVFINDSYSSDPQSVEGALRLLKNCAGKGRKVFLFGGLRGSKTASDYSRIAETISREKIDLLGTFGNFSFSPLISKLKELSPHTDIFSSPSYSEALERIKPELSFHDTVLIKGSKKEPFENILRNFHESHLTNLCCINLAAIENNLKVLATKLTNTRLMVMVKAMAYGTDGLRIAKFLEKCGIDILGVSYVDEAIALLKEGAKQSFFVLNAADYEIPKVIKWGLEVGVSDVKFVEKLGETAKKAHQSVKVHLHIDTGMCRFGCRPENASELAKAVQACPFLQSEGIMTHFASSDNPEEDSFTLRQTEIFDAVIQNLEKNGFFYKWKHAANSAGAIRFHFPQYNMARIGLAAYGLYPSEEAKQKVDLRLAISLISRVVGINLCKKGETISYGRAYQVKRDFQKIAVLPIGYFDGLHRNYSGKACVLIRGQKALMVGKICMDYMMVDVTDIPDVALNDPVLIFGEDEYGNYLSPEELAESGNSIIHELITCLGPRIQRMFVLEESKEIDQRFL